MKPSILIHVQYGIDFYEISLRGCTVSRIGRYPNGGGRREDVDYNDLPQQVKDLVHERIMQNLEQDED